LCSRWLLPPHYEDDRDYIVLQMADNLAYECRRLVITQEYDKHIPERIAMTRLKERIEIIYKLNYESLKKIMESKQPDVIVIEPEIKNESNQWRRHPLKQKARR
jgi:predicted ATP-dependent serine protease